MACAEAEAPRSAAGQPVDGTEPVEQDSEESARPRDWDGGRAGRARLGSGVRTARPFGIPVCIPLLVPYRGPVRIPVPVAPQGRSVSLGGKAGMRSHAGGILINMAQAPEWRQII